MFKNQPPTSFRMENLEVFLFLTLKRVLARTTPLHIELISWNFAYKLNKRSDCVLSWSRLLSFLGSPLRPLQKKKNLYIFYVIWVALSLMDIYSYHLSAMIFMHYFLCSITITRYWPTVERRGAILPPPNHFFTPDNLRIMLNYAKNQKKK